MSAGISVSGSSTTPAVHPIFFAIKTRDKDAIRSLVEDEISRYPEDYKTQWREHTDEYSDRHQTLTPMSLALCRDEEGRHIWSAALCAARSEKESEELCNLLLAISPYCGTIEDIFDPKDKDHRSFLWHSFSKCYRWVFHEYYSDILAMSSFHDYNDMDSKNQSAFDVAIASPDISIRNKQKFFSDEALATELKFSNVNKFFLHHACLTGDIEIIKIALSAVHLHEEYNFLKHPIFSSRMNEMSIFDCAYAGVSKNFIRKKISASAAAAAGSSAQAAEPFDLVKDKYLYLHQIVNEIYKSLLKFRETTDEEEYNQSIRNSEHYRETIRLMKDFSLKITEELKNRERVYSLMTALVCTERKQQAEAVTLRACVTSESDERDEREARKKRVLAVDAREPSPGMVACSFLKVSGNKDILKKIFEYVRSVNPHHMS